MQYGIYTINANFNQFLIYLTLLPFQFYNFTNNIDINYNKFQFILLLPTNLSFISFFLYFTQLAAYINFNSNKVQLILILYLLQLGAYINSTNISNNIF